MDQSYRPSITYKGYKNAVKDYSDEAVVEELAANSYDADASTVVVLLNTLTNELIVLDDGIGFGKENIQIAATLGGGEKSTQPYSGKNRHYLGSYGVGLKSTLNISSTTEIISVSKEGRFQTTIDWNKLEEILKDQSHRGYKFVAGKKLPGESNGTLIRLKLNKPTDKSHLEEYGKALGNLPSLDGKFICYYGLYEPVAEKFQGFQKNFKGLKALAKRLQKAGKLSAATNKLERDLEQCTKNVNKGGDKEYGYTSTIYFAGMKNEKVNPLKKSLRGIFVRIHGRLLKHDFAEQDYTYNISKYMKFASGLRVELSIDWLRDQITLSRDGLQFSNPKLEKDFTKILQSSISKFIAPKLKNIKKKREEDANKFTKMRHDRIKKRISNNKSIIVKGCKTGFRYIPETDAELALLLAAQPDIIKKAGGWELLDYNDQGGFDCLFYERETTQTLQVELEPTLMEFLQHNNKSGIELIVTWKRGAWKISAGKKGKPGYLKLMQDKEDKRAGFYKLLEHASEKSKEPRATYPVLVLEEFLYE